MAGPVSWGRSATLDFGLRRGGSLWLRASPCDLQFAVPSALLQRLLCGAVAPVRIFMIGQVAHSEGCPAALLVAAVWPRDSAAALLAATEFAAHAGSLKPDTWPREYKICVAFTRFRARFCSNSKGCRRSSQPQRAGTRNFPRRRPRERAWRPSSSWRFPRSWASPSSSIHGEFVGLDCGTRRDYGTQRRNQIDF
jgi:hypothetical protein